MNGKMQAVTDKTIEKTRKKAVMPALCPVIMMIILLAASAAYARYVFSWGLVTPSGISDQTSSGKPLKVTNERPLTVFFSFMVEVGVSKVRFTISRSDRDNGVTLLEDTVNVKDNVAASRLSFNIHRGVPLGRHDLYIQAFDAERNVKILTGKIPYILLPTGSECMCQMVPAKKQIRKYNTGRYRTCLKG